MWQLHKQKIKGIRCSSNAKIQKIKIICRIDHLVISSFFIVIDLPFFINLKDKEIHFDNQLRYCILHSVKFFLKGG